MLKYFDLLLDLLEINTDIDKEKYRSIAKYILEHKEKKYLILHRYRFVFEAFLDLVSWNIDLEKFLQTGDLYSNIPLYKKDDSYPFDLKKSFHGVQNGVIILDELVWNMSSHDDLQALVKDNQLVVLSC